VSLIRYLNLVYIQDHSFRTETKSKVWWSESGLVSGLMSVKQVAEVNGVVLNKLN